MTTIVAAACGGCGRPRTSSDVRYRAALGDKRNINLVASIDEYTADPWPVTPLSYSRLQKIFERNFPAPYGEAPHGSLGACKIERWNSAVRETRAIILDEESGRIA